MDLYEAMSAADMFRKLAAEYQAAGRSDETLKCLDSAQTLVKKAVAAMLVATSG